jgi:EAL domain-containing protein (putative c-di-GMP-specific phosphodiesterase class I)/ActR/RegA family two-component response regulator
MSFSRHAQDAAPVRESCRSAGTLRGEKIMTDKSAINILAVDDEPFMLKLHMRALANLGYNTVTLCEGAPSALETMDRAAAPPDLILMDLNMPVMDGIEFMRHLVQRSYAGSLILVSGEDERMLQAAEKLVQAHHLAILGYLRKPVKPDLLAALLEKWTPPVPATHWTPLGTSESPSAKKNYSAEDVRSAIANGELVNYYQPKVSLSSGHVVGVETLVRWKHPVDGLVFPDQFIGVAEAHGLIRGLTRTVVANALTQAKSWLAGEGLALEVAINVSMDDLKELDFADFVSEQAASAGVLPQNVTLEVTESRLMQDLRVPLEVLTRLRLKRFRISIDDFGTGHSSLAQLRDIPFDELKIDRGFVHRAWADETVRAIFDTSVLLAKQLGMQIVAEGVEDRADWDYVRRAKCNLAQGYFISKPMPASAVHDWIEDWEERVQVIV